MKFLPLFWLLVLSIFAFQSCKEKKPPSDLYQKEKVEEIKNDSTSEDQIGNTDTLNNNTSNEVFDYLVNQYENTERGYWQNPELVLDKLGDVKNYVVADIGAGTGYFAFPLAARAKKVIAIDIDPRFLDYIEDQKLDFPPHMAVAIETRLSENDNPLLQKEEIDIALMVNVYPFISDRVGYLTKVNYGLRPEGVLFLIDYKLGELSIGPSDSEKVSAEVAQKEVEQAGYSVIEIDKTSLQFQYIIKAKKKS